MSTGAARLSVVLDVDPGIDDAVALLCAMSSELVSVEAVLATWGNVGVEQATRNALLLVEEAGGGVPVHRGEGEPRGPAPSAALDAAFIMGADGLGGRSRPPAGSPSDVPAPEALVAMARARPGELVLVALAPLSTVARALDLEPELPALLGGIVVMGGALAGGNLTAAADANFAHDPEAAARVIDAFGAHGRMALGDLPRLVPLDVTERAVFHPDDQERLGRSSVPGARFLHEVYESVWQAASLEGGGEAIGVHDLLAVLCLTRRDICEWETLPLAVDTAGGPAWGATIADRRLRRIAAAVPEEMVEQFAAMIGVWDSRWEVATGVDVPAYRAAVGAWLTGQA